MNGWKSYLLWEGLPFLMLFSIFGFISALNWDYERKLISLDEGVSDWTGVHMGLILLAMAIGQAVIASFLLLLVRVCRPKRNTGWFMGISLILIALFLIFPSLFIIVLGPSVITMNEQMRTVPR